MISAFKEGGSAAHTLPPQPNLDDQLHIRLRDHLHRLKLIRPAISVAVMALHSQNAELDHDIATVLDHFASEALDSEIDELEAVLASLATARRPKEVAA